VIFHDDSPGLHYVIGAIAVHFDDGRVSRFGEGKGRVEWTLYLRPDEYLTGIQLAFTRSFTASRPSVLAGVLFRTNRGVSDGVWCDAHKSGGSPDDAEKGFIISGCEGAACNKGITSLSTLQRPLGKCAPTLGRRDNLFKHRYPGAAEGFRVVAGPLLDEGPYQEHCARGEPVALGIHQVGVSALSLQLARSVTMDFCGGEAGAGRLERVHGPEIRRRNLRHIPRGRLYQGECPASHVMAPVQFAAEINAADSPRHQMRQVLISPQGVELLQNVHMRMPEDHTDPTHVSLEADEAIIGLKTRVCPVKNGLPAIYALELITTKSSGAGPGEDKTVGRLLVLWR
jgi:hypothetical protein